MPARVQTIAAESAALHEALASLRLELDLPHEFPREALDRAAQSAADPDIPSSDETDIRFVTIDPEGAQDLDQALHLERDGGGYTVRYAIADVSAFVTAGDAVDDEARRRGQTLYAADGRIPLHPESISERAGSLLPGQIRPALVWELGLDARGELRRTTLRRSLIRSREQLSYAGAQRRIDDGSADASLALLRTIGELRIALEAERGGASLDMPEEQIVDFEDGFRIERRTLLPAEQWNAQISLLTGMAAADLMLEAGQGVLRTMPKPDAAALQKFRAEAAALGFEWPTGLAYGEFLRGIDRSTPEAMALLQSARRLFRGADYTIISPGLSREEASQAAIGAPYAHTTAPLRRLVDRYVLAHCLAIAKDRPIPGWAAEGLAELPEIMRSSSQRAGALERASVDLVEIAVLHGREGDQFEAVVIEQRADDARIQLVDPPTEALCDTGASAGTIITVRLKEADLASRTLRFTGPAS